MNDSLFSSQWAHPSTPSLWPDDSPHPDDWHYRQLRSEHERQLDDDYQAWRRHRFSRDFEDWRNSRQQTSEPIAPEHERPLQSLGRAISDTVTGALAPDLGSTAAWPAERSFERV
jgi:hypothetical protein